MIWGSLEHLTRRRQWHPTPVLLSGKSHGQRSLVGWSPWGREESDTTERLHFHFSLSCFGEGNGSPLQCSCLENPRDGGAWWAAVYGVTQSWTRLKWLSSSRTSHWSNLAAAAAANLKEIACRSILILALGQLWPCCTTSQNQECHDSSMWSIVIFSTFLPPFSCSLHTPCSLWILLMQKQSKLFTLRLLYCYLYFCQYQVGVFWLFILYSWCALSKEVISFSPDILSINIYLFGLARSLLWHVEFSIFVAVCRTFSYGMWTLSWGMSSLVPWPGIEPRPSALGAWSLATGSPEKSSSSFLIESVLVSCGCYNELPLTWWVRTTQIYFLTVLEPRSSKSVLLGWNVLAGPQPLQGP